ncbi:MAG: GNAT family N-acetyltransferase [Pseudomonadales bacterium]
MPDLISLSATEHRLAGNIIAESFADDPVNLWVFGNQAGMTGYYRRAAKQLYLRKGYGHRFSGDGCTLWLPPGVSKTIPPWQSLGIAASMLRHSGIGAIARGSALDAGLASRHPDEPHHYLFAIGTRPAMQGRGIGKQLMNAGLAHADADRLPAYLESSKQDNVPFYQHFGFEVMQRFVPTEGAPPLWLMWREGRKHYK